MVSTDPFKRDFLKSVDLISFVVLLKYTKRTMLIALLLWLLEMY